MKLDRLLLENFRCYHAITLELDPRVTVLVANNGKGKTALLDAMRIGLSPFVHSFDLAKAGFQDPANTITIDDVLLLKTKHGGSARQLPTTIALEGDYGKGKKTWKRFRESEAPKTKTKDNPATRDLKKFVSGLQKSIRNVQAEPIGLPVLGYYGTGRLWKEKRLTQGKRQGNSKKEDVNIRSFAYRDCLDPASSFKQFEEWFVARFKKVREDQLIQLEGGSAELQSDPILENPIKVVQKAANVLLKGTGWKNLAYSQTQDASLILHRSDGVPLKVEQLSDGIKNMVAMVADIAYRCALLNAHLGTDAGLKSTGFVMIDEVDMHLHPEWQQTVVDGLLEAFPKIQFVLTTHSPQVLSTLSAECIRVIDHEVDPDSSDVRSTATTPKEQTRGIASADAMAAVQEIDPIPDVQEARWLSEYKALIQENKHRTERGEQLRKDLERHFGAKHSVIGECNRLIRLIEMKAQLLRKDKDL